MDSNPDLDLTAKTDRELLELLLEEVKEARRIVRELKGKGNRMVKKRGKVRNKE